MVSSFQIGARTIGSGSPCFVIAEAGVNHNGDVALARRLVEIAAQSGADAVKFQTFTAERVVTRTAPQAEYQQRNTGVVESQYDMLKRLELSADAHRDLQALCRAKGILFMSTPFDEESADFLVDLGVLALKIPSGELTNLPFLEHMAHKGIPLIVSTGMASLQETQVAVNTIRGAGQSSIALLHCVSNYPALPADCNLRAMCTLGETFRVPAGYSDHTDGIDIALAAAALGASVIEKHFTVSRLLPGPDHRASLQAEELAALTTGIRRIEAALGDGIKRPVPTEASTAAVARRSLVAACDIPAGTLMTKELIAIRRPGTGLPPADFQKVLGRSARVDITSGLLLTWDMFA